jgi:tRNA(fMet)-specific endonuclease VapC
MKYLLDTNIVSSWATRENPALLMRLLQTPPSALAICSVVKMELLYGLALKPGLKWMNAVRKVMDALSVVAFDEASAEQAARLRAQLRTQGTPIGHYDLLIAGTALANGLIMVTNNTREFSRVPGLIVEDWLA